MPEAPIPTGLVLDDLPGFPHPRVTLRPLTVGGMLRLQRVDLGDPAFALHLVAECMIPKMSAAELEALPAPQLTNVNRLIHGCTGLSGALFRREEEESGDPPA